MRESEKVSHSDSTWTGSWIFAELERQQPDRHSKAFGINVVNQTFLISNFFFNNDRRTWSLSNDLSKYTKRGLELCRTQTCPLSNPAAQREIKLKWFFFKKRNKTKTKKKNTASLLPDVTLALWVSARWRERKKKEEQTTIVISRLLVKLLLNVDNICI